MPVDIFKVENSLYIYIISSIFIISLVQREN